MSIGFIITVIVVSWVSFALGMIFGLFIGSGASPDDRRRFDDWSEGYRAGTEAIQRHSQEFNDRQFLN